MIFSLEGNIGSGKSTILQNLITRLKGNNSIIFLQEPVTEWEKIKDSSGTTILENLCGNQKNMRSVFK